VGSIQKTRILIKYPTARTNITEPYFRAFVANVRKRLRPWFERVDKIQTCKENRAPISKRYQYVFKTKGFLGLKQDHQTSVHPRKPTEFKTILPRQGRGILTCAGLSRRILAFLESQNFFQLRTMGRVGAHNAGFGLIRLSQNPSFFRQLCIPLNQPREGIHLCIFSGLENYVSYLALVVDF
jgi:hypothetical protein